MKVKAFFKAVGSVGKLAQEIDDLKAKVSELEKLQYMTVTLTGWDSLTGWDGRTWGEKRVDQKVPLRDVVKLLLNHNGLELTNTEEVKAEIKLTKEITLAQMWHDAAKIVTIKNTLKKADEFSTPWSEELKSRLKSRKQPMSKARVKK